MTNLAIGRALRRIYLTGLACAVAAALGGIAVERARFGPTDEDAMTRVERSVRAEIDAVASALNDIAASVGREPALFDTAAADPAAGARPLLDRADQALQARTAGVFAVTAYRPSGAWPLAWSGVPSEIDIDRIAGAEAFFVAPGPLGLRLVYIKPILDALTGHRVGVIAAERVISSSRGLLTAAPEEGVLSLPTLVPVTVRPYEAGAATQGFVIQSPLGQPLLVARVTPQAVRDTRIAWRENISAVVLAMLALTLVVSLPPLVRWRMSFPQLTAHLKASGVVLAVLLLSRAAVVVCADRAMDRSGFSDGSRRPRPPAAAAHAHRLPAHHGHRGRHRRSGLRSRRTAQAHDQTPSATSRQPSRVDDLRRHANRRRRHGRVAACRVRSPARQCHRRDVGRCAAFLVASAGLGAPRVCGRLILAQAVVFWTAILIVLLTAVPWRLPRSGSVMLGAFVLQALPVLLISVFPRTIGAAPSTVPAIPTAFAGLSCLALAWAASWVRPRYRHASQALRLFSGALVLLVTAFVLYPSVHHFADRGLRRLIEEEYARQVEGSARGAEHQAPERSAADRYARDAAPDSGATSAAFHVQRGVRALGAHESGERASCVFPRAVYARRAGWPAGSR